MAKGMSALSGERRSGGWRSTASSCLLPTPTSMRSVDLPSCGSDRSITFVDRRETRTLPASSGAVAMRPTFSGASAHTCSSRQPMPTLRLSSLTASTKWITRADASMRMNGPSESRCASALQQFKPSADVLILSQLSWNAPLWSDHFTTSPALGVDLPLQAMILEASTALPSVNEGNMPVATNAPRSTRRARSVPRRSRQCDAIRSFALQPAVAKYRFGEATSTSSRARSAARSSFRRTASTRHARASVDWSYVRRISRRQRWSSHVRVAGNRSLLAKDRCTAQHNVALTGATLRRV